MVMMLLRDSKGQVNVARSRESLVSMIDSTPNKAVEEP